MATTLWTYQFRGDTAANWTAADPVLLAREIGLETDTNKFKFGDGVTAWTGLPYAGGGGGGGGVSSVALTLPSSVFTVTGSPITSSGTLAGSFNTQPVNTVFAGPASGGAGAPTFRALTIADLPGGTGTGTVTSVGLSLPAIFNVTGTPVTTSGTLTASLASQTQNMVWASPNGVAGAPTFRSIVGADLPIFGASGGSHAPGAVPDPGATAGTTKFLREDATWAVPPGGGGSGTVTSVGLALPSSVFTVTGSPVTGSGTLTGTFATQTAATVFAAPAGSTGTPSFRSLVGTDVPVFGASGGLHSQGAVPDPGSTAGTTRFLREDATWAVATGTDPILTSLVNGYAITDQRTSPPATAQGFDQTTSPGGVTVSAGNTTVTTSSSTATGVLGLAPLTGNVYFEYKLLSGTPTSGAQIGIAPLGTNLTTQIGLTDGGGSAAIVPQSTSGAAYGNNGAVTFPFAFWGASVGDVVCIAYNSTTRQMWANINNGQWYNNTSSNNPTTNLGGITITGTSPLYLGITTQAAVSFQANLTSGTFAYSPPSGYSAPTVPPPNDGDTYIVAPGATGAWAGQDNNLAVWYNSQWNFVVPKQGFEIYVGNRGTSRWWNGTAWADGLPVNATDALVGAVPIANGGTNATTATAARTNLGAAASGANSDITSLSGLTTPLSIAQGGTGATTAAGARTNLGAGTVSSVGLSLPSIITVTGSPVTGSGTLAGTLATQSANAVFAGPTTGAAAAPTFRALVAADVPSQSGRLLNVQIFPSSGTYTSTPGTNSVVVEIQGGGGAGGGAPTSSSGQASGGGSGGAGGYVKHQMTSGFSGAAVVVGAPGAASAGATGGAGGSSSFAGIVAGGGGGGAATGPAAIISSSGGAGGSASGGSVVNVPGQPGLTADGIAASGIYLSAPGAMSRMGGGGLQGRGAAGSAAGGFGSGGGGTIVGGGSAVAGGAGAPGLVIVWEYS